MAKGRGKPAINPVKTLGKMAGSDSKNPSGKQPVFGGKVAPQHK